MNRLVRGLSALTIGYLLILSMFRTCLYQPAADGTTRNVFLRDHWGPHIIEAALLILLLHRLHGSLQRIDHSAVQRVTLIVIGIYLVCGLAFLFSTQLAPSSDGAKVMAIAEQILAGDVSAFEPSGYMYRYPFQRGMVLLDIVAIVLFGESAYLAMQVLNLLALITILVCLVWFVDQIWQNAAISVITALLQVLFLPIGLYITHNYGILYGIAFSFLAICLAYRAWTSRLNIWYVPAAVAAALAVELKSNSLIWLIGLSMALLFSAISVLRADGRHDTVERRHAFAGIAAIIGLFLAVRLVSACTGTITEHITGAQLSQGMPKTCWIYMGLQDDDDAPGAYNGNSTALFEEYDYDYDATNEEAIHRIVQLFGYMVHNPGKTVRQFYHKTAFEWNNPTFESIDIQRGRISVVAGNNENPVVQSLGAGVINSVLVQYMNLFQTIVLAFAGMTMIILWRRREVNWWEIVLLTIYLGGFAFHLFWEAKPQYTLPYFLLLIPYAAYGMVRMVGDPD